MIMHPNRDWPLQLANNTWPLPLSLSTLEYDNYWALFVQPPLLILRKWTERTVDASCVLFCTLTMRAWITCALLGYSVLHHITKRGKTEGVGGKSSRYSEITPHVGVAQIQNARPIVLWHHAMIFRQHLERWEGQTATEISWYCTNRLAMCICENEHEWSCCCCWSSPAINFLLVLYVS